MKLSKDLKEKLSTLDDYEKPEIISGVFIVRCKNKGKQDYITISIFDSKRDMLMVLDEAKYLQMKADAFNKHEIEQIFKNNNKQPVADVTKPNYFG